MITPVDERLLAYKPDADYFEWGCCLTATCDGCGRELSHAPFEDIDSLRSALKDQKWRSTCRDGAWLDFCPKCSPRYARPGPEEFEGVEHGQG